MRLSQAYEELVQDASAMRHPTLPNFAEHLIFLKNTLDGCLTHLSSLNDTPDKLPVAHPRLLAWSPSPSGNEVAQPSTCADGSLRTSHARKKVEQSHHRCGQTGASRRGRQVEDCQWDFVATRYLSWASQRSLLRCHSRPGSHPQLEIKMRQMFLQARHLSERHHQQMY